MLNNDELENIVKQTAEVFAGHKVEDRLKYNRLIIEKLALAVEMHPDLRFHQILQSSYCCTTRISQEGPVGEDHFNEEPSVTLKRINERSVL